MKQVIAGDSMSDGRQSVAWAQPTLLMWPSLFSALRGEPLIDNLARGGWGVADQPNILFGRPPATDERYFVFVGNVDQANRGGSTGALDLYESALASEVAWFTTDKTLVNSGSWSFTGTWSTLSQPTWTFSPKVTWTNNDYATVSFTGDVCEISYLVVDTHVGNFTVHVDGNLMGTYTVTPPATINWSGTGAYYCPSLLRISGCGAGSHTAVITKTSGSGALFLLWISQGSNAYPCYVLTLPNNADSATQTRVNNYNTRISTVVSNAVTAGANVTFVDTGTAIVPDMDLVPSDIHLVQSGHAKYAAALNAVV